MKLGMSELLIVFGILILMFGAKRLPALADGMGKAIRNFKKGLDTDDDLDVTPSQKQVMPSSSAGEVVVGQSSSQPVAHKS